MVDPAAFPFPHPPARSPPHPTNPPPRRAGHLLRDRGHDRAERHQAAAREELQGVGGWGGWAWVRLGLGRATCAANNRHAIQTPQPSAPHFFAPPTNAPQANSFELEIDSTGFAPYQRGGLATQHKPAKARAAARLPAGVGAPSPALRCGLLSLWGGEGAGERAQREPPTPN